MTGTTVIAEDGAKGAAVGAATGMDRRKAGAAGAVVGGVKEYNSDRSFDLKSTRRIETGQYPVSAGAGIEPDDRREDSAETAMTNTKMTLTQFASKRAATGALVAGLVNALFVYVAQSGIPEVPIFALVAEHWNQSLIGALIPRAVLVSLLVTAVTVWATVKSRAAGAVHPPIDAGVPWFGRTLKVGLTRAVYGFLLVLAIALLLRALLPTYTAIPSAWVTVLVAVFAAAIAYVMSYTAVLKTAQPAAGRAASA